MIAERWPNDPNRTPATAANLCAALLHKAKVMREIHGVDSPLVQAAQNEAFSVLDEAYVRWPDSPEVRSQRGWLFHQLGGLEDAIKEYSALIHLQTNNADALRRRAQLYAQLRRNDEAIADFKAAERIDGIKANITFERAQPEEEYSHA
jgi:tetratricopeptide (TPR) repeat protein